MRQPHPKSLSYRERDLLHPLLLGGDGGRGDEVFLPPRRRNAFTLIELLIVLIIISILAVPLAGLYVFPLRVHATLSEMNETSTAAGLFVDHLSEDVRCARSIASASAEGTAVLRIDRGEGPVVYRADETGIMTRRAGEGNPLVHRFPGISATFSVENEGQYRTVRAEMLLQYNLLRGPVLKKRSLLFSSVLEARP